ncbi:ABC transporter permease [Streptomyces rhizosphaerihabitans]|uniref:ABC transporter permease n=1 Tax=Streptomyces rhizosphaerihabitans TaxID=1266770 RepID=UPI0021C027D5|nr:ABC transporter permease [Streptomyces rhizosphaerihabitans]MCT9007391.1 ABC transporter permease [Streptomyces rhizosphaerihabitans]
MSLFLVSLRFQLRLAPRSPGTLQVWATAPLFTAVFLSIAEHAGRTDLTSYAIVAPTLMGQWALALGIAGELITEERSQGTLEAMIATPCRLSVVVVGRICAVSLLGITAMAEAWLVAGLGFGRWIAVPHPFVLGAALLANAAAMAGTASILSSLFVLMPSARIVQNTLNYPLYLLSGVLVPLSTLPGWLRPFGRLVFLSWSADLFRDALDGAAVSGPAARIAVVALLGLSGYVIGALLLARVLRRVRRLGTLTHT